MNLGLISKLLPRAPMVAVTGLSLVLTFGLISKVASADQNCAGIESDAKRLACYDALYRQEPAERASAVAPAAVVDSNVVDSNPELATEILAANSSVESAANPAQNEQADDAFGRETLDRTEPPASIESVISSIAKQPRGHRVFTLENGQVWREIEESRSRFQEDMTVEVVRTPFGSYLLKAGNFRKTKVRRLN